MLQWHIRNDFISRAALMVLSLFAALALIARNTACDSPVMQLWLGVGALWLCGASFSVARFSSALAMWPYAMTDRLPLLLSWRAWPCSTPLPASSVACILLRLGLVRLCFYLISCLALASLGARRAHTPLSQVNMLKVCCTLLTQALGCM